MLCESIPLTSTGYVRRVLIDTWWNVNQMFRDFSTLLTGFNRYMVECEFFVDTVDWGWFVGFNRYMVECELYRL